MEIRVSSFFRMFDTNINMIKKILLTTLPSFVADFFEQLHGFELIV